jgi:hypothetical protein
MSILSPNSPSGTGFNLIQGDGRADTVPASRIGLGPEETVVSLSLFRHTALNEHVRMEIGGATANLFNHPNYAVLGVLDSASVGSGFGQISNLQTAEGAGPR